MEQLTLEAAQEECIVLGTSPVNGAGGSGVVNDKGINFNKIMAHFAKISEDNIVLASFSCKRSRCS